MLTSLALSLGTFWASKHGSEFLAPCYAGWVATQTSTQLGWMCCSLNHYGNKLLSGWAGRASLLPSPSFFHGRNSFVDKQNKRLYVWLSSMRCHAQRYGTTPLPSNYPTGQHLLKCRSGDTSTHGAFSLSKEQQTAPMKQDWGLTWTRLMNPNCLSEWRSSHRLLSGELQKDVWASGILHTQDVTALMQARRTTSASLLEALVPHSAIELVCPMTGTQATWICLGPSGFVLLSLFPLCMQPTLCWGKKGIKFISETNIDLQAYQQRVTSGFHGFSSNCYFSHCFPIKPKRHNHNDLDSQMTLHARPYSQEPCKFEQILKVCPVHWQTLFVT